MLAKTIICPVDFSETNAMAIDVASKLARKHRGKIFFVHVAETASVVQPGMFGSVPPRLSHLREKLNTILPTATEVSFEHHLLVGDPVDMIVNFAGERNADLIVMATHGHTGVLRLLMGRVAEGVVRQSPIPVLSLKTTSGEKAVPAVTSESSLADAPKKSKTARAYKLD